MSNFILKYKVNVKEENNIGQIEYGKKINKDLLIAVQKGNYKMVLFDFKLKKENIRYIFSQILYHIYSYL